MSKLSTTMLRTLAAIRSAGGEVHPEGGGYWRGSPAGERLVISTDDWRGSWPVTTSTVYSLLDRGLLLKIDGAGNRTHGAFRLSPAAAEVSTNPDPQCGDWGSWGGATGARASGAKPQPLN